MMLQIRPNCENCNKDLPANSDEAYICSYECTFCTACVNDVLVNVCPNCGGGFAPRPIRPEKAWREGLSRLDQKPSDKVVLKPVDEAEHTIFAAPIKGIPPAER